MLVCEGCFPYPKRYFATDAQGLVLCDTCGSKAWCVEIDEARLYNEKIEAIEGVFGMLKDLTPEQLEQYEEAIKREQSDRRRETDVN